MRGGIIGVLVVIVIGYAGLQAMKIFKARSDFTERVHYQLDFVDATTTNSVIQDIINDAKRFGIALTPDNIHIVYEDSDQQSIAQKFVGSGTGATFSNKRIAITVHYTPRILGIPLAQDITESKIKQVQAPRIEPSREMKELLQ